MCIFQAERIKKTEIRVAFAAVRDLIFSICQFIQIKRKYSEKVFPEKVILYLFKAGKILYNDIR